MTKEIKKDLVWPIVLIETILSNVGLFSVLPLLPLFFLNCLKFSTSEASYLLFFSALSLKLARFILYPLFGSLSARRVLIISFLLCANGFTLLGLMHSRWLIALGLFMIGMGYGSSSILIKVIVAIHTEGSNHRQRLLDFSGLGAVINLGAAIGPLIGGAVFTYSKQNYICFFAAITFIVATLIARLFPSSFILRETKASPIDAIIAQLKSKKMRVLFLITVFSGFLYSQFFTSVSVFVGKGLVRPDKIGFLFFVNSMIVVVGSIFLSKLALAIFKNGVDIICFAFGLFVVGFLVLLIFQTLSGAYTAIIIWTVAEIWLLSSLNSLTAYFCLPRYKTMGFIINALALGVGESLGSFTAMHLSSFGLRGDWNMSFISMSIISFLFFC